MLRPDWYAYKIGESENQDSCPSEQQADMSYTRALEAAHTSDS